jgi:hypothetical protein
MIEFKLDLNENEVAYIVNVALANCIIKDALPIANKIMAQVNAQANPPANPPAAG